MFFCRFTVDTSIQFSLLLLSKVIIKQTIRFGFKNLLSFFNISLHMGIIE